MVMDVVIEEGNPADSSRLLPMIKRIQAVLWQVTSPSGGGCVLCQKGKHQLGLITGYQGSGADQKHGMNVEKMAGSEWIYKNLKSCCNECLVWIAAHGEGLSTSCFT